MIPMYSAGSWISLRSIQATAGCGLGYPLNSRIDADNARTRIMAQAKEAQRCVWCGNSKNELTKDHVFPRGLGGTRQLTVPSCRTCQDKIRSAETEVARRSIFALYRLDKGPPPSDKKQSDSGAVEAKYVLVKDWLGGYNEVVPRSHRDPIPLPCIEFDVTRLSTHRFRATSEEVISRVRGAAPEDVRRLVKAVLKVVQGPPDKSGLLGEVPVELLSEAESGIASDPDFWPRVFLDLKGRLKIRARDGQEATQLLEAVVYLAQQGAFRDLTGWATGQVQAGTPHLFCLEWNYNALLRVVAKIAYGTACRRALPKVFESKSLRQIRDFVLGTQNGNTTSPVRQISDIESISDWPDHHVVLIESRRNQLQGIVVLCGACFIVDLGENPLPEVFARPVVAMSRRDGTDTRFVTDDVAKMMAEILRYHVVRFTNE